MKFVATLLAALICSACFAQQRLRLPIWTYNTKNTTVYGLSVGYTTTYETEHVVSNGVRFEPLGWGIVGLFFIPPRIADSDSLHQVNLALPPKEKINGVNLSILGTGCECKVNGFNIYAFGSEVNQVNGISVGVFENIAEKQNGIQIAYFLNYAYKYTGIQLSMFQNGVFGSMEGMQISTYNNTNEMKGIQIGIHNRVEKLKGVQIGFYNKARKSKGMQIGLWNVNQKRKFPLINFS